AFKQCGALRVESAVEFSSLLLALSHGKLPKGNRVGILSEGGGDCALTADACTLKGLDLPTFSSKLQGRLKGIVPEIGQVTNPVDMAMWEKIPEVAEIMLEGDEIDGLIVVGGFAGWDFLNPNVAPEVEASAEKMAVLIAKTEKPLLIYTYYSYADSKSFETLRDNRVPLFMDHHDAVNTMAGLVRYTRYKATKAERRFSVLIGAKPAAGESRTKPLLEHQANRLLETAGTPFPAYRFAATRQEAIDAAEEIGYPVVLKIISQDVLHKSEVGCVKLGLHTPEAVACAFDEVIANARTFKRDARITGALLSKMEERGGVEVIIGGLNDSTFGPTLMFGLGGVYVEVMRDVSFRVCPITPDNADQMIRELDGFPLLAGIRGGKPVNLESLRAALLNVSAFLMENPRIAQLDLNPVKVHERGLSVLDARLIQYAD
ncbi:MAG: acetate--CoA ligase family protein, partial [Candidatus Poribacteria bacterium]|nr:acetate--CoA ligase family protein [Candidatus Poribacteria bacterium]